MPQLKPLPGQKKMHYDEEGRHGLVKLVYVIKKHFLNRKKRLPEQVYLFDNTTVWHSQKIHDTSTHELLFKGFATFGHKNVICKHNLLFDTIYYSETTQLLIQDCFWYTYHVLYWQPTFFQEKTWQYIGTRMCAHYVIILEQVLEFQTSLAVREALLRQYFLALQQAVYMGYFLNYRHMNCAWQEWQWRITQCLEPLFMGTETSTANTTTIALNEHYYEIDYKLRQVIEAIRLQGSKHGKSKIKPKHSNAKFAMVQEWVDYLLFESLPEHDAHYLEEATFVPRQRDDYQHYATPQQVQQHSIHFHAASTQQHYTPIQQPAQIHHHNLRPTSANTPIKSSQAIELSAKRAKRWYEQGQTSTLFCTNNKHANKRKISSLDATSGLVKQFLQKRKQ